MAMWKRDDKPSTVFDLFTGEESDEYQRQSFTQWSRDGQNFIPTRQTQKELPAGYYEIGHNQKHGVFLEKVPVNTEELVRFPDSTFDNVIQEIKTFWDREEIFREYGIPFKRGILLYGEPGTGKSCLVKLIMSDVITRGGIVLNFEHPETFKMGVRALREVHPDKPIVVVMEDVDSILENTSRTEVLNILDGVTKTDKIIFLATTNYPEKLEERITNRPSRFDKRYEIDMLGEESRKMYFDFLFDKVPEEEVEKEGYDVEKWAKDTKELTISHLNELFVAVVILGDDYDETLNTLKEMDNKLSTTPKGDGVGFSQ